uniref:Uncharacterized protein n=1 Tax=Molossus molossus TaxID=27622 RepID=A0A7J8B8I8_MOLMO|nr:hypothetical protein HJG59_013173 [Molossus molossus]
MHIIFGSDSESETKETSTWEQSHLAEKPVKEFLSRTSGKLFDSSDEESDAEDNSSRFRIKPQFEGRAGKKLMDLQSHFGTDDRFRMDSRFLESDSEEEQEDEKKTTENEELAAEKLKALNIVQSILHTNLSNSTSKGSVAAKKFKYGLYPVPLHILFLCHKCLLELHLKLGHFELAKASLKIYLPLTQ